MIQTVAKEIKAGNQFQVSNGPKSWFLTVKRVTNYIDHNQTCIITSCGQALTVKADQFLLVLEKGE